MPLLETRGLTRRFPGVLALDHVDFAANGGEVHAVCGANGAGKSTLMNILAGALPSTSGTIVLDGAPVSFANPADARAAGISIVYQEFSSIPELSVADNIFLGREFTKGAKFVDRARARSEAQSLLKRYDIRIDPDTPVAALSVADRQLVELARALSTRARILILDEPTAVLSLSEQDKLFGVIRSLKASGILVLYISHRLEEIFAVADRVSVMRDGKLVADRRTAELTQRDLVRLMTGREVEVSRSTYAVGTEADVVLDVSGAETGGFSVRRGEIFGLAGLIGAGRTWIARRVALLAPRQDMAVTVEGRSVAGEPRAALDQGIVYLTEDRKRDGLFMPLPIAVNATAASMPAFSPYGIVAVGRERRAAGELLRQLQLVATSLDAPVGGLSGGNQQKVIFARALLAKPKVLICDEPTRGVDVGAKQEIYALLRKLAGEGVAIVLISSEFEELLGLCGRLAIVRDGRIRGIVANRDLDEHRLMEMVTGAAPVGDLAASQ
jgi:ABC-type sugar transport system ATPase subunit